MFEDHSSDPKYHSFSARVLLPSSVDRSVREAHSQSRWNSEKNARRDASFRAYIALHKAGLINDNLLPIRAVDPEIEVAQSQVELRPNIIEVAGQIDLWLNVASAWKACDTIHAANVTVSSDERGNTELFLLLPLSISNVEPFTIYWDMETSFSVNIGPRVLTCPPSVFDWARLVTVSVLPGFH